MHCRARVTTRASTGTNPLQAEEQSPPRCLAPEPYTQPTGGVVAPAHGVARFGHRPGQASQTGAVEFQTPGFLADG